MARYIDGDKLLEYYEERHKNLCKKNGETDAYCQGYEDAMYVAEHIDFAADVVPRAEVENLQAQIAQYQLDLHYSVCREDEAAARTAREIFEEIEKHLQEKKKAISMFKDGEDDFYDGEIHALDVFEHFLTELKKKYTKGELENDR